MRLKTFYAKSMTEAMRQVKEALGDDAIIVATRDEPGGSVRITAAVEQTSSLPAPTVKTRPAALKKTHVAENQATALIDDEDGVAESLTSLLLAHRTPSSVAEKIISAAASIGIEDEAEALTTALAAVYKFEPLPLKRHGRPIVLVGPPGAGKTLTSAKLAARATLNGLKASVITTDTARAGGIEQLQAFLDILSIELKAAEDTKTLKQQLTKSLAADQIIVDTGGLNPFDPVEMKELALILKTEDAEAVLVLPAGIDAEESAEMAMTFGGLVVKKLLPTRLDFARRLGGLLAAADRAGMAFCDASHTPNVAMGLLQLTPRQLAEFLLSKGALKSKEKAGQP